MVSGGQVSAGRSADEQAQRARRAAAKLEKKAAYAAQVADNYARGAAGEVAVATELEDLRTSGWRIVHDIDDPEGGNIDHLAIGPPGIAVIDAKNWAEPVTVSADRRLISAGRDRTSQLERLAKRVELVRQLVATEGLHVAVRGYVVLCGAHNAELESQDLGDLRVLGVQKIASRLRQAKGDLGPEDVEAVASTLETRLKVRPSSGGDGADLGDREIAPPPPIFDRIHRTYYVRPWKKGGHSRIYLRSHTGDTMGWVDVNTRNISVECAGDDAKLVKALLASADMNGIKINPGELPKVPSQALGGRLISRVARLHLAVLLGNEWRKYGKHRLYGTFIDPDGPTYDLGYVDLDSGTVHPKIPGPIAKDRGPAERYLTILQLRHT